MLQRLRVKLALFLTKGTGCTVVRSSVADGMRHAVAELATYVDHSGGLQDGGRIQAYRRIYALTTRIQEQTFNVEVHV